MLNTPRAREVYLRRYPDAPEEKFVTIPNGFDPDDYRGLYRENYELQRRNVFSRELPKAAVSQGEVAAIQ